MDDADDKQLLRKSLTIVPTQSVSDRNDSILESETCSPLPLLDKEGSLTFDQSIAPHKYAGSFRLRFSTSESTIMSNKGWTKFEVQPESIIATPVFDGEAPQEVELQEISLNFIGEGEEDGEDKWIVHSDSHQKNQNKQLDGSPSNSCPMTSNNTLADDGTVIIPDTGAERVGPPKTPKQAYELKQANSTRRYPDNRKKTQERSNRTFKFFLPEEEPILNANFETRARRAVESVVNDEHITHSDKDHNTCAKCYSGCCDYQLCTSKKSQIPKLSPEMKMAISQGFSMMQKLLFPAMPKFLTDILVLAELAVTMTQFVLSLISISIENNRAYNIAYIIISAIALLLALIDSFVYFIQLGSCASIFHSCYSMYNKRKGEVIESMEEAKHRKMCCQFLGPKVKRWLSQSFELLRTILSELLIYPLVILDLFDLIVGGTYLRETMADRINFSLFVVGSTFLVLSVYFTRIFMVVSAAVNIRRTPLDPSNSKSSMIDLVTQFCVHVIFQIVAHVAIIVIVGVKIHQENPDPCADLQTSCKVVSPFLLYSIIVGGILPLYGIGVFFIIKYYNLRELSMGFWVNMLALLQSESFAVAVFSFKAIEESKERVKHVIETLNFKEVKHQLMNFGEVPTWVKFLYPLRFPVFVAIAAVYEFLLVSFIASLAFSTNETGEVEFVLFDTGLSSVFFIVGVVILIANLHVLALVSMWILSIVACIILLLLQPVIWMTTALLYIPLGTVLVLINSVFRR